MAEPVTGRRMGRPSLGVKATQVRLPEGMGERIDAVAGKNRRAIFIRDAVAKELIRQEQQLKRGGAKRDDNEREL
jgi:predicted transcriptional regulator